MSKYSLYLGSYTRGGSEGIYLYEVDADTAELTLLGTQMATEPSYVCLSPDGKTLYAVQETMKYGDIDGGSALTYKIEGDSLIPQKVYPTYGGAPCHVSTDKGGHHMFVANYMGGNVAVYPLKDGVIAGEPTMLQREGSGPNTARQEKPHAHFAHLTPDEKYLAVCDLGTDSVALYPYDPETGIGLEPLTTKVEPGDGPRHLAFSPCGKFMYLVTELGAAVYTFAYDDGKLTRLQRITMMPEGEGLRKAAAAIRVSPDGRFVYATNRFTDLICIYKIEADGTLSIVEFMPIPFVSPRDINFLPGGKFLLVGCETGDVLAVYEINKETGKLSYKYHLDIPHAVCVCPGLAR